MQTTNLKNAENDEIALMQLDTQNCIFFSDYGNASKKCPSYDP